MDPTLARLEWQLTGLACAPRVLPSTPLTQSTGLTPTLEKTGSSTLPGKLGLDAVRLLGQGPRNNLREPDPADPLISRRDPSWVVLIHEVQAASIPPNWSPLQSEGCLAGTAELRSFCYRRYCSPSVEKSRAKTGQERTILPAARSITSFDFKRKRSGFATTMASWTIGVTHRFNELNARDAQLH